MQKNSESVIIVTAARPLQAVAYKSGYIHSPQRVALFLCEEVALEVAQELGLSSYSLYKKEVFIDEYKQQIGGPPEFIEMSSFEEWQKL